MRYCSRFRLVGVAVFALPLLTANSALRAQQSQSPKDRLTIADYFRPVGSGQHLSLL